MTLFDRSRNTHLTDFSHNIDLTENRFEADATRATEQQASSNNGNVEAIAEAYPEEPQGAVLLDQAEEQYNEVIPLNGAPVAEQPKGTNGIPVPEREIAAAVTEEAVPITTTNVPTTVAPKKKVHIALDIPDNTNTHDETESEEDDAYPYAPQNAGKPSRNGGSPMYTFFPVSFGRAAGGTIAVANAYSTGKGAVRSHAIAYGTNGASRSKQVERHLAAQKTA